MPFSTSVVFRHVASWTVFVLTATLTLGARAESIGSWHLVWSDEFNQPNGSQPNPAKWGFDQGGTGWGNNELEYYTARTNNARIEHGNLVIEAKKENFGGRGFTSARLLTAGKAAWTYGRFEARIKVPHGQGYWPAFWLLGTNINSVNWPGCGEIDIMENIGKEPSKIHGTAHGPGYSGEKGIGGPATMPKNEIVADRYHLFAVDCESNKITWLLDGKEYFSLTPAQLPTNTTWVFNDSKFIILNLAIGGTWPGNPDATTAFPQRMLVDYVRVYQR